MTPEELKRMNAEAAIKKAAEIKAKGVGGKAVIHNTDWGKAPGPSKRPFNIDVYGEPDKPTVMQRIKNRIPTVSMTKNVKVEPSNILSKPINPSKGMGVLGKAGVVGGLAVVGIAGYKALK